MATALDICAIKVEEKPVIVVLKSITQCKDFLHYFRSREVGTDAYVFDAVGGDSAGAFGILNTIKKKEKEAPYPVVLTTGVSSLGFSFFDQAHLILVEEPADYTNYLQIMGRSNRLDPKGLKEGTLISGKQALDRESLEMSLKGKDNERCLIPRGCMKSLKSIKEMIGNEDTNNVKTAIRHHNQGRMRAADDDSQTATSKLEIEMN